MKHSILICSLLALPLANVSVGGEPQGVDYGQPRLLVEAPKDLRFAHLAWPKIVKAPDGTLVMAYSAGRFHGSGGEGCPAVSISTDGGKSFSAPKILQEFDQSMKLNNSANTALGVAEDGSIVLLAMAYTGDERNSIFGWRSEDSGRSWNEIDVSNLADGKTGSVYGHVFPVPGKGLAVTGHYRLGSKGPEEGIWIAYSQDHGRSWGSPVTITEKKLYEPATIWTGQRYVGLFRDSGTKSHYWQAVSDENGENWSMSKWPEKRGDDYYLPSPFLVASPVDQTTLYAFESRRSKEGKLPGAVYLWSASADKLDWVRRGTVVSFPESLSNRNDITYPWMAHIDENDWFVVFYCGEIRGPSDLYGMKITIH